MFECLCTNYRYKDANLGYNCCLTFNVSAVLKIFVLIFLIDTLEDNRMDTVCSEISTLHVSSHLIKVQTVNAQ